MLPKAVEYMLNIFDTFGYNSGSTKLSNCWKAASIIYFMHISMLAYFTYAKIHLTLELIAWYRLIDVINFLLQYSAGLYAYWVIILDSFLRRKEHRYFWEIIKKMSKYRKEEHSFTIRCYLFKFVEYFSFTLVSVVVMILESGEEHLNKIVFLYHVIVKICEMRLFYYMFCLELLHFQLTTINDMLKNIQQLNISMKSHRLKCIREYYRYAYEMTNYLNEVFSLSQIAAVSFCFYLICTSLNWYYGHYKELSIINSQSKSQPISSNKKYLYK